MANFVLVYKGGGPMPQTDAEREQVMGQWGQWYGQMGEAVVDGGNPFGASASVSSDGNVKDGAASGLTGYTIVKADSMSAATNMAKGCPILTGGGTVEVYETFQVM
jgi:hypothetical protein